MNIPRILRRSSGNMKRNVMRKNLLRTIKGSIGRYIAIMGIIALGSSIFVGLLSTKTDMVATGEKYMAEQNLFDLRLLSTYGWTQADVDAVAQMEGVSAAEGMIGMDIIAKRSDSKEDGVYKVHSIPSDINKVYLMGGRLPQRPNECLVDGAYANEWILGTKYTVTMENSRETRDSLNFMTFTVVGYVSSPLYMDMSRGSTNIGNGSVVSFLYLPKEAFNMDYYTEIAVTLHGDYAVYSDAFTAALENMAENLKPQIQVLADGRLQTLKNEAEEEYDKGYAEYEDGMAEYEKGKAEALQELADALQQLQDGQAEIDANRNTLEDAFAQLDEAQKLLNENAAALEIGRQELADARAEAYAALAAAYSELMANYKTVSESLRQVNDGLAQMDDGLVQLDAGIAMLEEGLPQLAEGLEQLKLGISLKQLQVGSLNRLLNIAQNSLIKDEALISQLQSQVDAAQAELDGLLAQQAQLIAMQTEYTAQLEQLRQQREDLAAQRAELAVTKKTLDDAMAVIEDGMLELDSNQVQADNQFAAAQAELESGQIQLNAAQAELDMQRLTVENGLAALEKAQTELDAGFAEYEQGRAEVEAEFAKVEKQLQDANTQLQDAREAIDSMAAAETFILDRNTNVGYLALDSNSDIVAGVSRVFPAFFLLVAALVCITTMTRMVEEERTQIGTFKALGYSNRAIISKYIFYAGSAAVVGCGLGTLIGSAVFPSILWFVYDLLLDIPVPVVLKIDWQLCLVVVTAYTIVMLLVTWYCCRRSLREVPAELIRPRAPTSGKKIFLEYLPFWRHISFLNKVMLRNVFRYRQRMLMMLIGIGGCTALLLTGFGLRDSIVNTVPDQFGNVTVYDLQVYFSGGQTAQKQEAFLDKIYDEGGQAHFFYQSTVDMDCDSGSKEINMIMADSAIENYIHFTDNGENLPYPGVNQALISVGAAEQMGIKVGDAVTLRNSDMQTLDVTITGIYHNNVYNYIILAPETVAGQWGSAPLPQMAVVNIASYADPYESGAFVAGMADVMNVTIIEEMASQVSSILKALDTIVVVIVICAGALAVIVLYNLTNINITERIREIATIKVLGFRSGESAAYVFKENLLLSAMGTVVGLGMGYWLLSFVISQIKVDMIWLTPQITALSCVVCVVLTMVFAVLVDFLLYFKLEKINMAEALKSVE